MTAPKLRFIVIAPAIILPNPPKKRAGLYFPGTYAMNTRLRPLFSGSFETTSERRFPQTLLDQVGDTLPFREKNP
jgi:hypothetical protein